MYIESELCTLTISYLTLNTNAFKLTSSAIQSEANAAYIKILKIHTFNIENL